MESIEGYVERITFRNEENGYTVMYLVEPANNDEEICCVGYFSYINEGEYIVLTGKEVVHKKYGPQFQVTGYEEKQPEDTVAIEKYLSSGTIKGIGPVLAEKIVKKFGRDTFKIIEREPERLAEIRGISMKMAMHTAEQFMEKQTMRQAMLFLQDFGISMNMAVKVYKFFGNDIYDVIRNNPYKLAENISGIGFRIADNIAQKAGFSQNSGYRIKAGIMYALQQSFSQGHCYLPEEILIQDTSALLQIPDENIQREIENMTLDKDMIVQEVNGERLIYLSSMYYMEMNCARMLIDLNIPFNANEKFLKNKIAGIEKEEEISLDELQKSAIIQSVKNGVMIITGGPGTGKTTTINTIIRIMEDEGLDILLAAPTGRAAKRMSETTGREAQTIHRLLEINGGAPTDNHSSMHFERNEFQPLEADAIIVDEFSMVDIYILQALLKAIVPGTRLIMVGDVNQLPSVGPGNVLKDMIKSGFCNVVRLNRIFRQAAESEIVNNAHKINAGQQINLDNKNMDFFHLERNNVQDVINVTVYLIMRNLPPYVNADSYDIQVLVPMRKGELGVENLNKILQKYMNPKMQNKGEHEFHGVLFRENDKVMQIKNNYQIKWFKKNRYGDVYEEGTGVFNGDTGVIKNIVDIEEKVVVEFEEGKLVEYDFGDMDEIELAYAITIHKSQGSEYPAVIIPIISGPKMLLNRNLLYTAVTRARKCVTLVGSSATVHQMIRNVNEKKRYSSLCQRIIEMEEMDSEQGF